MSTIIVLILLAMAGVGAYLFWKQNQSGSKKAEPPKAMTIENVRPGGFVRLSRVGPDMEDIEAEIVGRHLYEEDGFQWFELEGESASGKVWIDVEEDDEIEVSVSVRKLRLSDLGLTRESLDEMVRRDEGTITFEGRTYEYEDDGEASFMRNGDRARSERLRYWDFESEDGKWFIAIEAWGDEYQAHLSQAVSLSQIEVFSLGGNERDAA